MIIRKTRYFLTYITSLILGMRITVEVRAGAREEGIEKTGENHYLVKVKAPPKKGKANQAVLKALKKYFGMQVALISGATSTIKIVEVIEEQN